jgi:D-amino-acid dehydrogenase
MSGPQRVVVVGCGVVGAACAHYLAKAGRQVTMIDQGEFGAGCSHANCGYVCPSHVLPLATPGAVGSTLKAMFAADSPFYIKPRLDMALLGWLTQFALRCNQRHMLTAGRAIQALLNSSRRLYEDLLASEGLECEWETKGLLFVFQTAKAWEHYAATDALLREHFQMPAHRIEPAQLHDLEPTLKPGLAGGWHYPGDAHLRPDRLMRSWRSVLERLGVTIHTHRPFAGLVRQGPRVTAVRTQAGELPAEAVVIATGAWTPHWQKELGCRIPIQPGKGYSITMPRPGRCPTYPLIFEEHRVAVTPFATGYRIGSTMEFAGYDTSLNPGRLAILRRAAELYLVEPLAEPVEETWYGWRPMTYDSLPLIGPVPKLPNVFLAAGHNMLGLSMAPATGRLVAELLTAAAPHVDPTPYRVDRF